MATPAFVQTLGQGEASAGSTSIVVALSATPTAGNQIRVVVAKATTVSNTVTVTDDAGNTYTSKKAQTTSGKAVEEFLCSSVSGSPTAVTVTFQSNGGQKLAAVIEYTAMSGTVDSSHSNIGASGNATDSITIVASGTMATATICELLKPTDYNIPAGWNQRMNVNHTTGPFGIQVFDQQGLSPGSNTFTATFSLTGASWTVVLVAYKAQPSGVALRRTMGWGK